ncbi:MAG: YybS family protein [Thermodesulfobacteriota bacterium]|nr:YybS family protein [Thermodesulfobacteriota bacterium]
MKITDVLGCTGWAAFFVLASAWIPFVGPIISLLTPLPFLYYSSKLGFYQGVKVAAITVFIIGLVANLTGKPQIVIFCVEFSLLGLALSEFFRRRLSIGQTIFFALMFMLLLGIGVLFFLALSKNMGPFEMMLSYLGDHLEATIKAYEEMGISQEDAMELQVYGKAFMDIISRIYPSLMIIGAGFTVWLNVVVAKPLFRMRNLEYPEFVPMDQWRAPDNLIWGLIVSGFALFLASGSIQVLAINVMIVMMAVYFFHGLSIVLFFFSKYYVPSWIRIGVYCLIIIQQLFLVILILAGIFDQWIDFRKIHRKTDS